MGQPGTIPVQPFLAWAHMSVRVLRDSARRVCISVYVSVCVSVCAFVYICVFMSRGVGARCECLLGCV